MSEKVDLGCYPRFDTGEIEIGRILGKGNYCCVYELSSINLKKKTSKNEKNEQNVQEASYDKLRQNALLPKVTLSEEISVPVIDFDVISSTSDEMSDSHASSSNSVHDALLFNASVDSRKGSVENLHNSLVQNAFYSKSGKFNEGFAKRYMSRYILREGLPRYAIKKYKATLKSEYRRKVDVATRKGAQVPEHEKLTELSTEINILSMISHPNIIKMRGFSSLDQDHADNFIVLDRLFQTLQQTIYGKWLRLSKTINKKLFGGKKKKIELAQFWVDRLVPAYDLSSAFKYLDKQHIIYRDLKPENVGFDVRGDIKLFDFGIARELHPDDDSYNMDGTFMITPIAGSRRYMAPEVGLKKPYNKSADVFSFGILLWEICSLSVPFQKMSVEQHESAVWHQGVRPKPQKNWPSSVCDLLSACWNENWKMRPKFSDISSTLLRTAHEMDSLCDGGANYMNRSEDMEDKSKNSYEEKSYHRSTFGSARSNSFNGRN